MALLGRDDVFVREKNADRVQRGNHNGGVLRLDPTTNCTSS
jgi:hypothetical protein